MVINWRERVVATAIHFVVTLLVACLAAAIIFFIWYPDSMALLLGGVNLFLLVFASDLVLGPLLSLVVYSSQKSRLKLIIDYSVIGAAQLGALTYGLLVVAASRPVFVAFDMGRLEVVTAIEVEDVHLAEATDERFRSRSWLGPKLVTVVRPTDAKEKSDLLFLALAGKDVQYMPKYYREFDTAREQFQAASLPVATLLEGSGDLKPKIASAVAATGQSENNLRWLLVRHRFGFGVALIDGRSFRPLEYLPFDPIWVKGEHEPDRSPLRGF